MITKIRISTQNFMINKTQLVKAKRITTFICAFSIMAGIVPSSLVKTSYADTNNEHLTEVYKTIGPDGSISFSDTPADNAQSIKVKPITTVPAFSPIKKSQTEPSSHNNSSTMQNENQYSVFSFIQPANNSSFHSASGTVKVLLNLEPSLQSNDKVKILLDGKPIALKQSLSHTLSNIDRGTHTLTAQVLSHDNTILKNTSTSFTIHRPSIKR